VWTWGDNTCATWAQNCATPSVRLAGARLQHAGDSVSGGLASELTRGAIYSFMDASSFSARCRSPILSRAAPYSIGVQNNNRRDFVMRSMSGSNLEGMKKMGRGNARHLSFPAFESIRTKLQKRFSEACSLLSPPTCKVKNVIGGRPRPRPGPRWFVLRGDLLSEPEGRRCWAAYLFRIR